MPDLSYELIKESMKHSASGEELFQIKAVRDIPGASVKKGDLGGWIGKYAKLLDDAWISGDARVYGTARVHGTAQVYGNARVYGTAQVYGTARVHGTAQVYGNARVYGNSWVHGNARVHGDALVYGNSWVHGNARVHGDALVYGDARVCGDDIIKGGNGLVNIINPSGYSITVTKKYFYVGCRQFPIGSAKKNLLKTAIMHGFSESQYKNYKRVIRSAMKLINIEDN